MTKKYHLTKENKEGDINKIGPEFNYNFISTLPIDQQKKILRRQEGIKHYTLIMDRIKTGMN